MESRRGEKLQRCSQIAANGKSITFDRTCSMADIHHNGNLLILFNKNGISKAAALQTRVLRIITPRTLKTLLPSCTSSIMNQFFSSPWHSLAVMSRGGAAVETGAKGQSESLAYGTELAHSTCICVAINYTGAQLLGAVH
ncbi:hypothetical protein Baya_5778 [Bagarius yarrelli]|uniref:Uncharacterized protein n=1 Tax=Bagarius yarrelli TaxID=175774 RepID=A0A556TYG8_BAGYA|nr:hypothetical protein Baya_5778 [Bagarius yarrelli]